MLTWHISTQITPSPEYACNGLGTGQVARRSQLVYVHVLAQVKSMSALLRKKILWTSDKISWCLHQRYAVVCVHVHKNKKLQLEVTPQK